MSIYLLLGSLLIYFHQCILSVLLLFFALHVYCYMFIQPREDQASRAMSCSHIYPTQAHVSVVVMHHFLSDVTCSLLVLSASTYFPAWNLLPYYLLIPLLHNTNLLITTNGLDSGFLTKTVVDQHVATPPTQVSSTRPMLPSHLSYEVTSGLFVSLPF